MKPILLILLIVIPGLSIAQTFQVGALMVNDMTFKQTGTIAINDSTVAFSASGATTTWKVSNRTEQGIYVTDGTATDLITIIPMAGKIKGFKYTTAISQQRDKRFDGSKLLFFCVLRP